MKLRQYSLIIILALIAGLAGGAVSGRIFSMVESKEAVSADIEIIKLFVPIGSAVLLAICIFVSALMVNKQIATTQQWNRRKSAFDVAASYTKEIHEHSRKLHEMGACFHDPNQTCDTIIGSNSGNAKEIEYNLGCMLSLLEEMALGIRQGVLDNDIAYDLLNLILPDVYRWRMPYIERDREHSETAYIGVTEL